MSAREMFKGAVLEHQIEERGLEQLFPFTMNCGSQDQGEGPGFEQFLTDQKAKVTTTPERMQ